MELFDRSFNKSLHSNIGKSMLVDLYIKGEFNRVHHPSIETTSYASIEYGAKRYRLAIVDTLGLSVHIRPDHIIGTHGFIIVYSNAVKDSFARCKIIRDEIQQLLVRFSIDKC